MTDRARIWTAASVTALFLAALSIAGIAIRGEQPRAAITAGPAVAAPQETRDSPSTDDDGSVVDELLDPALAEATDAVHEWLEGDE
jgi:hypothetical protein